MHQHERSQRTRRILLDSAAAAFCLHGYAGTKLDDVVAGTGLTKGALYTHFSSKDSLAATLTTHLAAAWVGLRQAAVTSQSPPLSALKHLTWEMVDLLGRDPWARAALRLMLDEGMASGTVPPLLGDMAALTHSLLRQAQRDGALAAHPSADTLSFLLLTALVGVHFATPMVRDGAAAVQALHAMWRVLLDLLTQGALPDN